MEEPKQFEDATQKDINEVLAVDAGPEIPPRKKKSYSTTAEYKRLYYHKNKAKYRDGFAQRAREYYYAPRS